MVKFKFSLFFLKPKILKNIETVTKILDIDLHTIVLDWFSFRDLQVSFLEASVPDVEIPSDIALQAGLFDIAATEKVKYIIFGYNFRDQGISPITWTYMDGKYIKSVHKQFSSSKLVIIDRAKKVFPDPNVMIPMSENYDQRLEDLVKNLMINKLEESNAQN